MSQHTPGPAATHWRRALAEWAIPEHIAQHAPSDPWHLDPALFRPAENDPTRPPSLATTRALDLLAAEGTTSGFAGSVLDVGCGGGAASFALAPPATHLHGVDQSAGMVALYAETLDERKIEGATTEGSWLELAERFDTDSFDVVVCHHVAYNVADLGPFVAELARVASRGVVLELTMTHPQTSNNPLWRQFWDLERPIGPSALDALTTVVEHLEGQSDATPFTATLEIGKVASTRREPPWESRVESARRMLCLQADRHDDVEQALQALAPRPDERAVIVVR